nr:hypothetical protein [Cylindrospermopsis raciborskii]
MIAGAVNATGATSPAAKSKGKFWVYEQAVKIPYYAIFNRLRHNNFTI